MTKRVLTLFVAIILSVLSGAAERKFAIVIDNETYSACKAEIENYRTVLESEGISAVVVARVWSTPMQVRDVLHNMYLSGGLEGAVFIGQIPIPMIRDAQHFTSAFKMDQELFPFRSSSVPSDRFYDDFDLKFDYLGRDSTEGLLHYFSLKSNSPQRIVCDIYSGRIKPTKKGEDGYRQIKEYFTKLLKERSSSNNLDVITSYTGEGSFSNSLTAWKEEGITLREQFPNAFKDKNSVKFLLFNMYPFMKDVVTGELQREELDLMIFHEHGMPHRQYLTSNPPSKDVSEHALAAKKLFRAALRREKSQESRELLIKRWKERYRLEDSWFEGALSREMEIADSLEDLKMGIVIEDVEIIKPNARVVIFDACYNGDFREDRYIAGEYIFAPGKTVVTIANSVNVLQDKSSSDLMGLIGLGYSIGEWMMNVNILESHIIGDPTFKFGTHDGRRTELFSKSEDYWLNVYKTSDNSEVRGLALYKLFNLNHSGMQELLLKCYRNSGEYSLRLQAFHLIQYYNENRFAELLKKSVYDPYEFIRRRSVFSMGRVGSDLFIPIVASVYLNDNLDERVHFNSMFCFDLFNQEKFQNEVKKQLEQSSSIYNKDLVWSDFVQRMESRKRIAAMSNDVTDTSKSLKARLSAVRMLRNNAYHGKVDEYLKVLRDKNEDVTLRIALAEALGWFTLSHRRGEIVAACKKIAESEVTNPKLRDELLKSAARLEVYMR